MQPGRASPVMSRLGCMTTLGMVAILGILLRLHGGGPFSPGQLTAASPDLEPLGGFDSHADFEEECARCHEAWHGTTPDRCQACHSEVAEERLNRVGLHGRLPDIGRCSQCHTEHLGREAAITTYPLSDFEHDWLTGYSLVKHPLDYAGAPIACVDCHPGDRFVSASVSCEACHRAAEPAFVQEHEGLYGHDCQRCHDGQDTMAAFDHQAVFPLEDGHANLGCEACHLQGVFVGTPGECADCHQEPAVHAGAFGLDCARCHRAVAWAPAFLSYHTFPLDHGRQVESDCATCHAQTYVEYTCYGCHEHQPDQIRAEHLEEGIPGFQDCVACHPTGLEDEAERSDA